MKPWFVMFVLWALTGIVFLQHAYANPGTNERAQRPVAQAEEQQYLF